MRASSADDGRRRVRRDRALRSPLAFALSPSHTPILPSSTKPGRVARRHRAAGQPGSAARSPPGRRRGRLRDRFATRLKASDTRACTRSSAVLSAISIAARETSSAWAIPPVPERGREIGCASSRSGSSTGRTSPARSSRPRRGHVAPHPTVPPRGGHEPLARAPGEIAPVLVDRPELGAVAIRLLEVVADDLVQLDEVGAVLLEPVGEPLVQVGADGLRQRLVRGVADQQVAEAEGLLVRELRVGSGRTSSLRTSAISRAVDRAPRPA